MLGFGELNGIVTVMLALIFSVLVLFLIGAVVAARKVSQVPTFRLVSTNQPPELTLALGLTWNLFNSHIWSTGQDAVAVIKKQLMLLLPGIQVFLDVRTQTLDRVASASNEHERDTRWSYTHNLSDAPRRAQ